MSKTKVYNDKTLPFTIFSSSVNTGYQAELSTSFKPSISIENNHEDYNNEYLEGNIQGIYAKDLVGGHKSNHIEISTSYTPQDRPERYKLYFGTGSALGGLYITSVDSGSSKDFVSRFPFAKRPFGIQNIQGKNFRKNYEIVTTCGYKINNRDFYHSGGYTRITASEIPFLAHDRNYEVPARTKTNKSVLRTRFGLGEKKIGSYDYESQEYTAYNCQPWKNYTARNILKIKNSREFVQTDYEGDDINLGDYSRWFSKTKTNLNVRWTSKNCNPSYPYIEDDATDEITSSFCIVRLEPYNYSTILLEDILPEFRYHYKNFSKFDGANFESGENLYYNLQFSFQGIPNITILKTQAETTEFDSKDSMIYFLTGAYGVEGQLFPYQKPIRIFYNDKLTAVSYYRQLAPQYDNEFVTHQIPQNDIQYSWLARCISPRCYSGYYNLDRLATFFTSSDITQQLWTVNFNGLDSFVGDPKPATSFAGYSIFLIDHVDINNNTSGLSADYQLSDYQKLPYVTGSPAYYNSTLRYLQKNNTTLKNKIYVSKGCPEMFTALLHQRNGIYGWPSWKQYQTNNSLLRYQKKNSYINNRGFLFKESNISYNFPVEQKLEDRIAYKYSFENLRKRFDNDILEVQNETVFNKTFYDHLKENKEKSISLIYKESIYPNKKNIGFDILRRRSNFIQWWDDNIQNRLGQKSYNWIDPGYNYYFYFSNWDLDQDPNRDLYLGLDEIAGFDSYEEGTFGGQLQFHPTIFYRNQYTHVSYPDGDCYAYTVPIYMHPTTSGSWDQGEGLVYVFYDTKWEVAQQAGRQPYYSNYNQYLENIKPYTKNKTIIPEFRISEHIDNYLENGGDFYTENENLFTINEGYLSASSQIGFYSTYSLSSDDILKNIETNKIPKKIELNCEGLIKFYPYKGLYPVERTTHCAELFSSSYSWETGSDTYVSPAPSKRPIYQTLFMPGILYNTIKSGIAIDTLTAYPFDVNFSDSNGLPITGSDQAYNLIESELSTYDEGIPRIGDLSGDERGRAKRIPFETLVEPEQYLKGYISDIEVSVSSRGNFINYNLTNNDPKYQLSMHNFLAESIELFLKNGELSSFASKPQNKIVVDGNKINYAMIVQLYSKPWENLSESDSLYYRPLFYMFSSGSAFGPPVSLGESTIHNYSCFTPPYYEHPQGSTMLLKFTPWKTDSNEYTIEEIVNNLQIIGDSVSDGEDPTVGRGVGIPPDNDMDQSNPYYGSEVYTIYPLVNGYNITRPGKTDGLTTDLTSSINLNIVEKFKDVEYDPQTNLPTKISDTVDKSVWIIQTKYETPILNFRNCECDVSGYPAGAVGAGYKGMWMQYGQKLQDGEGVFLKIKDPETISAGIYKFDMNVTGSLADLVGFDKKEIRLGEVHESKFIREAVVAVPYMDSTDIREKSYFYFDDNLIDFAEKEDETKVSKNMINTLKAFKKYVFPPKFDWNKNKYKKLNSKTSTNIVKPIKMFVFEFEREFSSQDLLDIWQNIMPESYQKFEQQQQKITIDLEEEPEILQNIRNVKWMFFKVKQKAEKNYFAKTADTSDDSRFKFELKYGNKGRKNFVPDYSYNWPYDWMSIVEFCGVTMKAEFGED
jgi:hypothetical protein